MDSVQFIKINMIQNITLQSNFITAQNDKFLCLKPESEPPIFVWSRSRLRNLGLPEPEPLIKVAAPQHCKRLPYRIPFLTWNRTGTVLL